MLNYGVPFAFVVAAWVAVAMFCKHWRDGRPEFSLDDVEAAVVFDDFVIFGTSGQNVTLKNSRVTALYHGQGKEEILEISFQRTNGTRWTYIANYYAGEFIGLRQNGVDVANENLNDVDRMICQAALDRVKFYVPGNVIATLEPALA